MSRADQPFDIVARPKHYNVHSSGHEAIELTELLAANLSNALKYIWRSNEKGYLRIDLGKARWYAKRHCDGLHVPIFATAQLRGRFLYLAAAVTQHEQSTSLLAVALSALAAGEPSRMLQRIEEELAATEHCNRRATDTHERTPFPEGD